MRAISHRLRVRDARAECAVRSVAALADARSHRVCATARLNRALGARSFLDDALDASPRTMWSSLPSSGWPSEMSLVLRCGPDVPRHRRPRCSRIVRAAGSGRGMRGRPRVTPNPSGLARSPLAAARLWRGVRASGSRARCLTALGADGRASEAAAGPPPSDGMTGLRRPRRRKLFERPQHKPSLGRHRPSKARKQSPTVSCSWVHNVWGSGRGVARVPLVRRGPLPARRRTGSRGARRTHGARAS